MVVSREASVGLTEGEGGYAKDVLPVFDDISDGCMGEVVSESWFTDPSHAQPGTDPLSLP